ncbi:hypothetical protein DM01DRAFT_1331043 [Hesseltinella vesiculosa]|uniref:F-box domain-containing protein n=1 Tax=Hesseltinella vesiculosa TaxID=101127 RepID=A0A1X2GZ41_9FUNG|nr:hypothetical protein DM01DRAFT_1331043 [Hesseltinella vesiculosa]
MSLPFELFAPIIQHLPPRYLLTTALVSHAWYHLSLTYLYRIIYIHTRHQQKRFIASLPALPLVYRQSIEAVYVNAGPLHNGPFTFGDGMQVLAANCPHLHTFALVSFDGRFQSHPLVTLDVCDFSVSTAGNWKFALELPPIASLHSIRTLLKGRVLLKHIPIFHQLTDLELSGMQLSNLMHHSPTTSTPASSLLPALETLELRCMLEFSSLQASHLTWIQQHCPRLGHLSLKTARFDYLSPTTQASIHPSVVSLALKDVIIADDAWLPFFASVYPSLQSLSLDMHLPNRPRFALAIDVDSQTSYDDFYQELMAQAVVDLITACKNLTSLSIARLGQAWLIAEVIDELVNTVDLGTWDCRLKRLAFDYGARHSDPRTRRLLECPLIMQQLEVLHVSLPVTRHPPSLPPRNISSCDQFPSFMFPPCDLAPEAMVNLTSLSLYQEYGNTHASLMQLLRACPALITLTLRGIVLHYDACQTHSQAPSPSKFDLVTLSLLECDVSRGDLFYAFLKHQLPRLSSLAMVHVRLNHPDPDPLLDLDVALKSLWIATINLNGLLCAFLCFHEKQGSGLVVRYTSQSVSGNGNPNVSSVGPSLRVACRYADHVVFSRVEGFFN